MQSLIRDQVMSHMKRHNLYNDKKFGFLDGRSTVTCSFRWVTKIMNKRQVIDRINCNFKKASQKTH